MRAKPRAQGAPPITAARCGRADQPIGAPHQTGQRDPSAARARHSIQLPFAPSPMDAVKGTDALPVVTEWQAFRSPDFERVVRLLR